MMPVRTGWLPYGLQECEYEMLGREQVPICFAGLSGSDRVVLQRFFSKLVSFSDDCVSFRPDMY